MSDQIQLLGPVPIDRRRFMGVSLTLAAAAFVPAASLVANAAPAASGPALLRDWTIDDMWGVDPRYADPIGYGRPQREPAPSVHPVDEAFVA